MKTANFSELIKIAALQLFREKGVSNVSTRDLTQKLNISRSHIYHYYRDWETLKKAAIQYMLDTDIQECHDSLSAQENMTATDKVHHYIQNLLPDAPSAHWLLYLELWPMAARDADYANLVHNQSLQWITILEEIIRFGVNNGEFLTKDVAIAARQINALIDGYSSMLILDYSEKKRISFLSEISHLSFKILKNNP
ncbi:transcriptional regulator, TetR family [Kosakonia oryzendophytica]|uniref:Transcriptional regulator, TetR family n=1 Tax=Kosakonia oryzendophytica TaxID=1005665 RepID=A0A1C4AMP8_9ENTR|nr:TetR/AcrR family transcriptional regulator [Kosakonia oryzendophytica]AMO50250.1 Transcriptional regulator, TetR family [Enterobacter sp. FY-07]TDT60680.1 TetR family transcriptional regulator [Enterobacter sp. AG5470]WBT57231.1 TetR/AcrR family transcriptional regulator [Kosakonia oryzendophytica]SCB95869.1 transcriptional regulator, TetR family [Kosakonia oryzendophytica]